MQPKREIIEVQRIGISQIPQTPSVNRSPGVQYLKTDEDATGSGHKHCSRREVQLPIAVGPAELPFADKSCNQRTLLFDIEFFRNCVVDLSIGSDQTRTRPRVGQYALRANPNRTK